MTSSQKTDPNYFEISKGLEIFNGVFKEINMYYVDDTKPGELMDAAIESMLKTLDPYTTFIPESEIEDFIKLLLENNISYNVAVKVTCKHFEIKKNTIYKKYMDLAKK